MKIVYDADMWDMEATERDIMAAGTSDMITAYWMTQPYLKLSMANRAINKQKREEEAKRKKREEEG
jgi:hypothetical protein